MVTKTRANSGNSTGATGVTPSNPVSPIPDPTPPVVPAKGLDLVGGIDTESYYIRLGQISGWAGDKNNPSAYLDVSFYLDGDSKTGKAVITTKANLVGNDGDVDGDHAFIADIPVANRDGKPHKVYAYVTKDGVEKPLSASFPYTLSFFEPKKGDAQAIYNKIGFSSSCRGCHSFDYADRWGALSRDGTNGAWTKDNNYLINKLHANHFSGNAPKNICALINCPEVINWWTAEFGP